MRALRRKNVSFGFFCLFKKTIPAMPEGGGARTGLQSLDPFDLKPALLPSTASHQIAHCLSFVSHTPSTPLIPLGPD